MSEADKPHTHDDVGWLKTVDQYFYGGKAALIPLLNHFWKIPIDDLSMWKWIFPGVGGSNTRKICKIKLKYLSIKVSFLATNDYTQSPILFKISTCKKSELLQSALIIFND